MSIGLSTIPVIAGLVAAIANLKKSDIVLEATEESFKMLTDLYKLIEELEFSREKLKNSKYEKKLEETTLVYEGRKFKLNEFLDMSKPIKKELEKEQKHLQQNIEKRKLIESYATRVSLYAGLKSITNSLKKNNTKSEDKLGLVVSTLYMNERMKKILKGYFLTFLGAIILFILMFINSRFMIPFSIDVLVMLLIFSYQWVLKYRIEKGLFGTNFYEAKQLLAFVANNSDKFDGGRKVFHPEEMNDIIISLGNLEIKGNIINGV